MFTLPIAYQTGTWTPVLTFVTPGDLNVVYSTQFGSYTQIGNRVHLNFVIVTSTFTWTTASGNLRITGFTFTPDATIGNVSTGSCAWQGITKAGYTQIVPMVQGASQYINLQASQSGANLSNVTSTDMPSGGSVIIRGTLVIQI